MYDIEMAEAGKDFAECWRAAGRHLEAQADGRAAWIKSTLTAPYLEHISFRLGNQLFFVRIEAANGSLEVPGTRDGSIYIAGGCAGHACLMPMDRRDGDRVPRLSGWGLCDLRTLTQIHPPALITDALIEMTDWELHDCAVQIVTGQIGKTHKIMSSQGNPNADPSIWFVGDDGPEWVVVRAVRYPECEAPRPASLGAIAEGCARISTLGNFASVSLSSKDDDFDGSPPHGLWRGHGMYVRYSGLQRI